VSTFEWFVVGTSASFAFGMGWAINQLESIVSELRRIRQASERNVR